MPEVRTSYVVEASYAEDAAERRAPYRSEHLERIGNLQREGALLVAGAFADMSSSLLVLAVAGEEAAVAIVETDVYWRNRIWTDYKIRKLNRVVL